MQNLNLQSWEWALFLYSNANKAGVERYFESIALRKLNDPEIQMKFEDSRLFLLNKRLEDNQVFLTSVMTRLAR